MARKFPPRGYAAQEYPLPHNWGFECELNADAASQNCTYIPLILHDEGMTGVESVNVNPKHGSFAESSTPYCYPDSIIPKMMYRMQVSLTKGAIETDKMRSCVFNYMPVYTAFVNRLDAADDKTGTKVETILDLEYETVGKSCYPIWTTTKLDMSYTVGIHGSATTALMGMTTSPTLENIAFLPETFFDALQYYTNSSMLKKVVGPWKTATVTRDRPFKYYSNNFTHPNVKRINPYTFCGMLIYTPNGGDFAQNFEAADVTDISHLLVKGHVRYDEWNAHFDQTAI